MAGIAPWTGNSRSFWPVVGNTMRYLPDSKDLFLVKNNLFGTKLELLCCCDLTSDIGDFYDEFKRKTVTYFVS
jgi:hypothetical protein